MTLTNNISSNTIALIKGLAYTIITLLAFYKHPTLGIFIYVSFVFIYEYMSDNEYESASSGRAYFYLFSFILIIVGLFVGTTLFAMN